MSTRYRMALQGTAEVSAELTLEAEDEVAAENQALSLVQEGEVDWRDEAGLPFQGALQRYDVVAIIPEEEYLQRLAQRGG